MSSPLILDLLIVDDESEFRELLIRRFSQIGWRTQGAATGEEAIDLLAHREFDVAVLDMMLPGMTGLDLLAKIKSGPTDCEVVMLTGQATVETAVAAMKAGAYDYVVKPFPLQELEALIERANERRKLAKENRQLKAVIAREIPPANMIGTSPAMQEVFRLIQRAGPSGKAILIQ
jgi:DNA-binding NtrC family response regulator